MFERVLNELDKRGVPTEEHRKKFQKMLVTKPGHAPEWKPFYLELCHLRRKARLAVFDNHPRQYVYAKHHVMAASEPLSVSTTHQSDSDFVQKGIDYQMGAELCLLTIHDDGNVSTEVLLDCPAGVIRDPSVSFDGKRIAFSMRKNDVDDDFHLYVMELPERKVRQITFGKGTCDVEPLYLPSGDILFTSTRCAQTIGCWWTDVTNLYRCNGDGRYVRRIGFDQDHTIYPQLLSDGRIVYTRFEYNDRASRPMPAFMMNPDGTNQTEYYGNNSYFPTSLIHVRGIPGTDKAVGIIGPYHMAQHGKLVMIDRTQGTQESQGLTYICPKKEVEFPKRSLKNFNLIEFFAAYDEQFQYPWALNEDNYLVSYLPIGPIRKGIPFPPRGPYPEKFGIYWFGIDGERELLIYDPTISSGQHVPLVAREKPPEKAPAVDWSKDHGTFYMQDVYFGPGMKGIERGTAKKMRIVGIEPRASATVQIWQDRISGDVFTPIGVTTSSWDVKHVLGEIDIEEDGSALFNVPIRTPVYFQVLDEKGHVIQTMRSWAVLQPGETMACVGCHEDKNTTFAGGTVRTQALQKPPQPMISPVFEPGEEPVQEQLQFMTQKQRRAWDYLSVQAPQAEDVPRGFSYRREIQPIWDKHCISCHTGNKNPEKADAPLSLLGDSMKYDPLPHFGAAALTGRPLKDPGRDFSDSYLNLTKYGMLNDLVNSFPVGRDAFPDLQPPYKYGSHHSGLMNYLESSHYDVNLSRKEKNLVACWIDLVFPFCGSFMEANTWNGMAYGEWRKNDIRDDGQFRGVYLYHEAKRLAFAEVEVDHLDKYLEHLAAGKDFPAESFAQMTFGGPADRKAFLEEFKVRENSVLIHGKTADNLVRNLALNPYATTHQIRSYPHATSNSHHKYRAENSPKNLIDGDHSQDGPAWCPDPRTDLWVQVDFGREVTVEKTVLYLKVFPGIEKTWTNAALSFSDGSKIPITLRHTAEAQEFDIPTKKTRFVKLEELKETFPLGRNGIVEWEIFGKD